MVQVGFIGLGNMGQPMARNIVKRANLDAPLLVYNRTTSKAETLKADLKNEKQQVEIAPSIEHLVSKSDIIFCMLGSDEACLDMAKNVTSTAKGELKEKIWIDCASIHPDTSNKVGEVFEKVGMKYVSGPVVGAPAMADAGQLIFILASKSQSAITAVLPYTDNVMSKTTIQFPSSDPSKGTLMKFSANHYIMSMVLQLGESLTLAQKSGLGEGPILQFLSAFFGEKHAYVVYAHRMLDGFYEEGKPLVSVVNSIKDASHIIDIGEKAGVDMVITKEAKRLFQLAKEEQGDVADISSLYGAKRKESGLLYSNKEERAERASKGK